MNRAEDERAAAWNDDGHSLPLSVVPYRSPSTPSRRLPVLDGLRGLAILAVMVFHMTLMDGRCGLDRAVNAAAGFGWVGVDLFFVLSGFLITGILIDARGGHGYFRRFYARRTLRIFPLYYVVVAVSLLVLPRFQFAKSGRWGQIHGDEVFYWTHLSNYVIAYRHAFRHGILDVSWSLAIEEQFYLLWPAVVWFSNRKTTEWICVGVFLTAMVVRLVLVHFEAQPIAIFALTFTRMDALAAGAWVAAVVRSPAGLARWRSTAWVVMVGLGFGLAAMVGLQGPSWDHYPMSQRFGYSAVAVFFAAVVIVSLGLNPSGWAATLLSCWPLRMLGRLSYAIYLFNFPIRGLIRDTAYGPAKFATAFGSQLPGQMIFYAMSMTATIVAAAVSWFAFEQWFLKIGHRWSMPVRAGSSGVPSDPSRRVNFPGCETDRPVSGGG